MLEPYLLHMFSNLELNISLLFILLCVFIFLFGTPLRKSCAAYTINRGGTLLVCVYVVSLLFSVVFLLNCCTALL